MKRQLAALLLTIFALSLTACGETATESETRTVYAMDTVMNLTVYGENAAAALESAEKELHTLDEAVLSRTAEGSELYALNASNGETVECGADDILPALIETALTISDATEGAFDPTLAPVLDAWGFTKDERRVPSADELKELLSHTGCGKVALEKTADGWTVTLLDGAQLDLGGIAKGSGMIHPNLATMLVFLTTDCAISAPMLHAALTGDVSDTFNMVSVDGDTSTNDMVAVLANGLAGNAEITAPGADFTAFCRALNSVTVWLCRRIAGDGEGATRLIECCVTGAEDHATAKTVAKSIVCSSLVKAAMFGADANWGRVLCAIGYSGTHVDVHKVDVFFRSAAGTVCVCTHGAGVPFSEEEAKKVLLEKEIEILVDLNTGDEGATAWGCDLTYDYVKINGDYRT